MAHHQHFYQESSNAQQEQEQEQQPEQQQQQLLVDTLYCSEENWEEEESVREENRFFQEDEEEQESYCHRFNVNVNKASPFPVLLEQDLFWEDEELKSLLSKEQQNQLYKSLENNPSLAVARVEAVDWILKVHAHYSFTSLTAVLAVNYFDRFLFSIHFQRDKPWMTQLAAVACLSLAAKVEETQVPLLLDLQVEESRYVFEAKTIQRMEMLVLSTLHWKMNPVTPIQFLDYIARRLGLKDYLCWEFLRRCERTLLSVISDSRFMSYLPSIMATATMLHVINGVEPRIGAEYQNQLLGILGIDQDKVEDCCKLVRELASAGGHGSNNKRKFGSIPGSPNGVMDVSFSSDNSNDSWAVASSSSSVSSSPEPLSKKSRAHEEDQIMQRLSHASVDFLGIPR